MIAKHRMVTEAFMVAEQDLAIEVVAPFDLIVDGQSYRFLAFLPHFGSPKGMVVAAGPSDDGLWTAAQKAGYYMSSVNVDVYSTYMREHFVDTLKDWGFYGPAEKRPPWLRPEP
jgi:hypothetical protein